MKTRVKTMIFLHEKINTRILWSLFVILSFSLNMGSSLWADMNILVIGSSRSFSNDAFSGLSRHQEPFNGQLVVDELQAILDDDPLVTSANVVFEDTYQTTTRMMWSSNWTVKGYSLLNYYYWPDGKTARMDNLKGAGGTAWDYVVILGDPSMIASTPGVYAKGVKKISDKVREGTAEPVLMMLWPDATSSVPVSDFGEVTYRVGDSGNIMVAPSGYAWDSLATKDTGTHPTPDGAYLAAATLYNKLFNRNAKTSAYTYDDALADHAVTTVTTHNSQSHYSGVYNQENPYLILGEKGRIIRSATNGSSTEKGFLNTYNYSQGRYFNALLRPQLSINSYTDDPDYSGKIHFHLGRAFGGTKIYKNDPSNFKYAMGYPYQIRDRDSGTGAGTSDGGLDMIYGSDTLVGNRGDQLVAFTMIQNNEVPNGIRTIPVFSIWAAVNDEMGLADPWWEANDGRHYEANVNEPVASYMMTLLTGRCPIGKNGTAQERERRRIGYETSWIFSTLNLRPPGFTVHPSSYDAKTLSPSAIEEMSTYFVNAPQAEVTLNVSLSDNTIAMVNPKTLTFDSSNYDSLQNIQVIGLNGASASEAVHVQFSTSSTDMCYDLLTDSWEYTNSRPYPISGGVSFVEQADRSLTAQKNSRLSINLNVSGATNENTTILSPFQGNISWINSSNILYTPNSDYVGADSFAFAVTIDGDITKGYASIEVRDEPQLVFVESGGNTYIEEFGATDSYTLALNKAPSDSVTVNLTTPDGQTTVNPTSLTFTTGNWSTPQSITVTAVTGDGPDSSPTGNVIHTTSSANLNWNGLVNHLYPIIADNDNSTPIASGNSVETVMDTAVSLSLVTSDADGDALTYTIATNVSHGTLTGAAPNLIYTPDSSYLGNDEFTYYVNDGYVNSTIETISLVVSNAPVAANSFAASSFNASVLINLVATDADGDTLSYSIETLPSNGNLSGSGSSRTYTPNTGYSGSDNLVFKVNDGVADSNSAVVSIRVSSGNLVTVVNHSFETGSGTSQPPWKASTGGTTIKMGAISSVGTNKVDLTPDATDNYHFTNSATDSVYQVLSQTLEPKTTYTLSVDVGDRVEYTFQPGLLRLGYVSDSPTAADDYGLNLLTAVVINDTAPVNDSNPTDGWGRWESTFTTGPIPEGEGKALRIELVTTGGVQSLWDNVLLEKVTIPQTVPYVSVTASDASAAEELQDPGVWTISHDGFTSDPLTVLFSLSGTATGGGTDYNLSATSSVTIPAGMTSTNVILTPVDDAISSEHKEKAILTLSTNASYEIVRPSDNIVITENDNNAPIVNAGSDQIIQLNGTSTDPTPGWEIFLSANTETSLDGTWEDSMGAWNLTIDSGVSFISDTGSARPGISSAYDLPGGSSGTGGFDGDSFHGGGWDSEPVTIEIWFKPNSSADDGQTNGQILWETGGGTGMGIFYNDGEIEVGHDNNEIIGGGSVDVSALIGDFIQVVLTYDETNFIIYVNGQQAGTGTRTDTDWSGSDASGLGAYHGSNAGGRGNGNANTESFEGQIAIFRAYQSQVLTASEVEANYDSIASGASASANLDGTVSDADGDSLTTTWAKVSGPENYEITLASNVDTSVSFSATGVYVLSLTAEDGTSSVSDNVTITVADNTVDLLVLESSSLTVNEGGSGNIGVKLSAAPTGNVNLALSKTSGDTDLMISGANILTFTSTDWSTYQYVSVMAQEDDGETSNGTATFTVYQLSGAGSYSSQQITVTEEDDDLNLSLNSGGDGSVSGGGIFDPTESPYSISATPDSGYEFLNWSGNLGVLGNVSGNGTSLTTSVDENLTANFQKIYTYDSPYILVGGSTRNGNFNGNVGTGVSFGNTDDWYNLAGDQNSEWTKDNKTYSDASQNAVLSLAKQGAVATDHSIVEGDKFSISYVWRDVFQWVDGSDQVRVSLFVTNDDTITGTRTDLVQKLSGLSTTDDTYESVDQDDIYKATASNEGKKLFAVIESQTTDGFARLDNFELIVTPVQRASTPGVTVSSVSGNTTENGTSATFTVVLDSQPSADVTIGLTSSDTSEVTVSPSSLVFSSGNWNSPATVTVTGQDDSLVDGDISVSIVTAAATSGNASYNGLNPADVTLDNLDDSVSLTVGNDGHGTTSPSGAGSMDPEAVTMLSATPNANYTFDSWSGNIGVLSTLSGNSTTLSTSVAENITANFRLNTYTMTYNSGLGGTVSLSSETVNHGSNGSAVTATADGGYDFVNWTGDITSTSNPITLTSLTGDNTIQANFSPSTLSIISTDIVVAEGSSNTFNIRLSAQPAGNITLGLTKFSGDGNLNITGGNTLTFTTANWNVDQSITISADEDEDSVDGTAGFTITKASGLNPVTGLSVNATEDDNDSISLVLSSLSSIVPEGSTNTITVSLSADPVVSVTVTSVNFSGDRDIHVNSGNSLTFTSSDWNTPQTVTFQAGEDDSDTANGIATVRLTATGGHSETLNVTVTEADDDIYLTVTDDGNATSTTASGYLDLDNSPFSLLASPNTGYTFSHWSVLSGAGTFGSNVSASTNLTASSNLSVQAKFDINSYTLTYNVGIGGSVSQTSETVNHGSDGSAITATPTAGYDFVNWTGGITSTSNPITLTTLTGDNTIQANFTPSTLSVISSDILVPEGSSNTFNLRLSAQPAGNITLGLTKVSGDGNLNISGGNTLTFTTANWNVDQSISISGDEDDDSIDGTAGFSIVKVSGLNPVTGLSVNAAEDDNDSISLVVSSLSSIVPEGSTNTITVSLSADPVVSVTVSSVNFSGDGDIRVNSGNSLTFTSADWNVAQTVTFQTSEDDSDTADGISTVRLTATGGHSETVNVTVSEADDDIYLAVVDDGNAASTTASGYRDLDVAPFNLTASPSTGYTFSHWSVLSGSGTFSSNVSSSTNLSSTSNINVRANFNINSYTLAYNAGTGGSVSQGSETVNHGSNGSAITATPASGYEFVNWTGDLTSGSNPITLTSVSGDTTIQANFTTKNISVVSANINVQENGSSNLSIALSDQPAGNIILLVSSLGGDSDISLGSNVLSFTTGNWNTAQNILVSAADDADDQNGVATLQITQISGLNPVSSTNIIVTEIDDDLLQLVLNTTTLSVNEGEDSTFQIRLSAAPASDVDVVTYRESGDEDLSVTAGNQLTFTTANWSSYQTVIVSALEDNLDDANGSANIRVSATGGLVQNQDLSATESDDDITLTVTDDGHASSLTTTGLRDLDDGPFALVASAGLGYRFSHWKVTAGTGTFGDNTQASTNIVTSADLGVQAVFDIKTYTISYNAGIGGNTSLSSESVNHGSDGSNVTAIPDTGYTFMNWSGDVSSSSNPISLISVTGNNSITANFFPTDLSIVLETSQVDVKEGSSNVIKLKLSSEPAGDIECSVSFSAGDTDLSVTSGSPLTIFSGNWNLWHEVTVSATEDDGETSSDNALFIISQTSGLNNVSSKTIDVHEVDDDILLTISDDGNGSTAGSGIFDVDDAPFSLRATADSGYAFSSWSGNIGTLQSLSSNSTLLTTSVGESITANFDLLGIAIDVESDPLSLVEGGSGNLRVRLGGPPVDDTVLNLARSSGDSDISLVGDNLTFTTTNWNSWQVFSVVSAQDDDLANDMAEFSISKVSGSSSVGGNTFRVEVTDDDSASFILNLSTLSIEENGSGNFSVALGAQPQSNVVISVTSSDTGEATLNSSELTFSPTDWNVAQSTIVSGVDDDVIGDNTATITVSVKDLFSDDDFDLLADQTVDVSVINDDTPSFSLSTNSLVIRERGGAGNFRVTLGAQPDSEVVLNVASSNTTKATVSANHLVFSTSDWNQPQVITVTGSPNIDTSIHQVEVTVSVLTSASDDHFDSLTQQSVWVELFGENSAPVITQGNMLSVILDEDESPSAFVAPSISATDIDGDLLTWSLNQSGTGLVTVSGNGVSPVITYTPPTDWFGKDLFIVTVHDEEGLADSISIEVEVQSVNDEPMASGRAFTLEEFSSVSLSLDDLNYSDTESDELSEIRITALPENGTLRVGTTLLSIDATVSASDISSSQFTYTAGSGPYLDTFSFYVNDGESESLSTAEFEFQVTDQTAPSVISSSPTSGEEIYGDTPISFMFSEAISVDANIPSNYVLSGNGTSGVSVVSVSGSGAGPYSLILSDDFQPGPVRVQISGINDDSGNPINSSFEVEYEVRPPIQIMSDPLILSNGRSSFLWLETKSSNLTVTLGDNSIARINEEEGTIEGLKTGETTLTITDEFGNSETSTIRIRTGGINSRTYDFPEYVSGLSYRMMSFPYFLSKSNPREDLISMLEEKLGVMSNYNYLLWAYDNDSGRYVRLDQSNVDVALGQSFWVAAIEEKNFQLLAEGPQNDELVHVDLQPGWNLVGNPYMTAVPVGNILFPKGNETVQVIDDDQTTLGHHFWYIDERYTEYQSLSHIEIGQGAWLYNGSSETERIIFSMPNNVLSLPAFDPPSTKASVRGKSASEIDLEGEPLPPAAPYSKAEATYSIELGGGSGGGGGGGCLLR